MKKIIITILGTLLLFAAGISHALATEVRPYFDLHGGATMANDSSFSNSQFNKVSFDVGFVAGGAIGLDFDLLRLEANVDYRRSTVSKVDSASSTGNMQLLSYMVNAHLVAPIKFEAKPYLIGGLGFATSYIDVNSSKENNTKFAYQAGVGVGYEIKRNVTIDFNYRYLGTSDFDMGNAKMDYDSNNVMLGVRYSY